MPPTTLDHLVVACHTLDQGRDWCEATLGVASVAGGAHALMGTHNRLLNLSCERFAACYLELIAVDPAAPAPGRARWFGLDDPVLQARLAATGPELVGYVARSGRVDLHRQGLIHEHLRPGPVLQASRALADGQVLSWQIVVAEDGRPLAGGAVPTLIQWAGPHPTERLPASGLRLTGLTVRGMSDRVAEVLRLHPLTRARDTGPAVSATLDTPTRGWVTLNSHATGAPFNTPHAPT